MQRCNELEAELAELRAIYDLYFTGIERLPPLKKHDLFKRAYAKLKGSMIRQTAAKFRIETIGQKLLTYERLWDRTMKEIENGTYKRDLAKLKRRDQRGTQKKTEAESSFDVDEDLDLSDLDEGDGDLSAALAAAEAAVPAIPAIKPVTGLVPAITPVTPPAGVRPATGLVPAITPVTPAGGVKAPPVAPVLKVTPAIPPATTGAFTPPKITSGSFPAAAPAVKPLSTGVAPAFKPGSQPPPAKPAGTGVSAAFKPPAASPSRPAPAPVSGDGLSDTKIKAIYDAYVMAKKRCGEDTKAVTLDSVASSLKKQVPELMKQHNAKSVEFKVVIKDGKAILRALPKD